MNLEINKDQFLKILIYILPAALISGPLISDGIVIIISLYKFLFNFKFDFLS